MAGWVLAYVMFEMLHFITHFASVNNQTLKRFKHLHVVHHYR